MLNGNSGQTLLALPRPARYNPHLISSTRGNAMFREEKEALTQLKSKLDELRRYL